MPTMETHQSLNEIALRAERSELLEHIRDLQESSSADTEHIRQLHHYRIRYNNVMNSMDHLQPRIDPLAKLPSDLWIDILSSVLCPPNDIHAFYSAPHSAPALCTLLLVSRRWQELIMQVPKLWSEIELGNDISDKRQDMCILLTTFLHFSQSHLLSLRFRFPFTSWDIARDQLAPHRHRIQKITFRPGFINSNTIAPILRDLLPLPNLIYVDGMGVDTHRLLATGSPLEEIRMSVIDSTALQLPGARYLRRVATYETTSRISTLASNLPSLTNIVFDSPANLRQELRPVTESEDIPLKALNWTSICFTQQNRTFQLSLLNHCPNLISLDLRLKTQQFIPLMNVITRLVRLTDLSLHLEDGEDNPIQFTPRLQCPSVESLTLDLLNLGTRSSSSLTFIVICFKIFNLRHLRILGVPKELNDADKSLEEKDLPSLEQLELHFRHGFTPLAWPAWLLSSLHKLVTNLHPKMMFYSYHPTVRILDLRISDHLHSGGTEVNLSGWPELRHLTSSDDFFTWKYARNRHLRHISLQCTGARSETGVMKLVQQLAHDPTILPALESLNLGICPEWDIFFIMLEQRNIFTAPSVSRITQVTLPRRCPTRFYSPIRELLGGRLAERPSNYDLSIIGNIEVILDIAIPGCLACHKALAVCSSKIVNQSITPESIPPYPESNKEIVKTWELRDKFWRDLIGKNVIRQASCVRHNILNPRITLQGLP